MRAHVPNGLRQARISIRNLRRDGGVNRRLHPDVEGRGKESITDQLGGVYDGRSAAKDLGLPGLRQAQP